MKLILATLLLSVTFADLNSIGSRMNVVRSGLRCYTSNINLSGMSPKLLVKYTYSTYSRKPGDYNGTIIFEIDIMKNSSPINLNLR